MRKVQKPHWLVPTSLTRWDGRVKKRTISVFSKVDEWTAQNIAGRKIHAGRTPYLRYKALRGVHVISIDHAISFGSRICNWGCCDFNKGVVA